MAGVLGNLVDQAKNAIIGDNTGTSPSAFTQINRIGNKAGSNASDISPVSGANASQLGIPDPFGAVSKSFGASSSNIDSTLLVDTDAFYRFPVLDIDRFNRNPSYKLVIFDTKNNSVIDQIYFPLPPQSISYSAPTANTVLATMKGIVEDCNGAPFRRITVTGTSGVNLMSFGGNSQSAWYMKELNYAFKNTIQKITKAVDNIDKAISAFTGGNTQPPEDPPLNEANSNIHTAAGSSGFAWIHALERFLSYYLAVKKRQEGRYYRLVFQMYKDQMYFDCVLNNFSFTKPPGTLEYQYNIQLTAYKRRFQPVGTEPNYKLYNLTPAETTSVLSNITAGLKQTKQALVSSFDIFNGLKSDFYETVLAPINALGAIFETLSTGSAQMKDWWSFKEMSVAHNSAWKAVVTQWNTLIGPTGGPQTTDSLVAQENSGRPTETIQPESTDNLDKIINEKDDLAFFNLTSSIDPSTLPLKSQELYDVLQQEFNNYVTTLDTDPSTLRTKLIEMDDSIEELDIKIRQTALTAPTTGSTQLFDRIGILEAIGAVTEDLTDIPLNTDQIALLNSLNDASFFYAKAIKILEELNKNSYANDYGAFYASYATNNGIAFQNSQSKVMVPFPPGASLESLAVQYLGDADRWIEIAAINGLRAPYVDEDGFYYPLKINGAGNILTLSTSENLYIGQRIGIMSDIQTIEFRYVQKIDIISDSETLVTVDGAADLSKFKTSENAKIHTYLPNTVNYLKLIAIPSQITPDQNPSLKISPNQTDLSQLAMISKTDLQLQSDGDLMIKGNDVMLAIGYQNLVQAAMIKFKTKVGSLVHDPTFGNPIYAGRPISDIDIKQTAKLINKMFTDDPRFTTTIGTRVRQTGPAMVIDTVVGVRGVDFHLPLTTDLPR